jgi:NAD-dependent DNA ligase
MSNIRYIDLSNITTLEALSTLQKLYLEIHKYNQSYYQDNISLVSDAEYDQLMELCKQIEAKFPDLITRILPLKMWVIEYWILSRK